MPCRAGPSTASRAAFNRERAMANLATYHLNLEWFFTWLPVPDKLPGKAPFTRIGFDRFSNVDGTGPGTYWEVPCSTEEHARASIDFGIDKDWTFFATFAVSLKGAQRTAKRTLFISAPPGMTFPFMINVVGGPMRVARSRGPKRPCTE